MNWLFLWPEPVATALTLIAAHPATPGISQAASIISNVALAIPCLWGLKKWLGVPKALQIFLMLGIFAWTFEAFSVLTGWPYSPFVYGDIMAGKIAGLVPWTVPFAWVPLLLGSGWVAHTLTKGSRSWQWLVLTAAFTTLVDVVLDPAAVAFGFWIWEQPGVWYGVPLQNYFGWIISALIGASLVRKLNWSAAPKLMALSSGVSLSLWTIICFALQFWLAGVIGLVATTGFWYVWRKAD